MPDAPEGQGAGTGGGPAGMIRVDQAELKRLNQEKQNFKKKGLKSREYFRRITNENGKVKVKFLEVSVYEAVDPKTKKERRVKERRLYGTAINGALRWGSLPPKCATMKDTERLPLI